MGVDVVNNVSQKSGPNWSNPPSNPSNPNIEQYCGKTYMNGGEIWLEWL